MPLVGVREQRRRDVVAVLVHRTTATAAHVGALLSGDIRVTQHLLHVLRMDQRADLSRRIERMPDRDALDAPAQRLDERLVDRSLDQRAARRSAALAVEAVNHEERRIEGAVQIGVREHDHRVLAAQLEMHAFERCRALRHDRPPGGRLADKRHRRDRWMHGQGLARFLADAVNEIDDTSRGVRRASAHRASAPPG